MIVYEAKNAREGVKDPVISQKRKGWTMGRGEYVAPRQPFEEKKPKKAHILSVERMCAALGSRKGGRGKK